TGETYDESIHPGVIDPHVFFDESDNLWMVYGSYSGGIFIIELDPSTGYPLPDQGYGTRIAGGDHAPMEGPNIHYSSETGYYYLFLSFGTLDTEGGYNIRVARSENPDGPYYDPSGNNMLEATGDDWDAVERYGAKLIGNFEFSDSNIDYVSPGHNSVLMGDKNYIFFHTRFNDGTEDHEVRVHQLYMNSEGWPVIAPHRYGGETIQSYSDGEIAGSYQLINHGKEISSNINSSITIELSSDGNIAGDASGNWSRNGNDIELTIDGTTYNGILTHNWDDGLQNWVITFSALSQDGVTIWGSQK
ncbi:MAG: glycoside hydrolase family 43 protein, partial [Bacillota bacterium]